MCVTNGIYKQGSYHTWYQTSILLKKYRVSLEKNKHN